MMTLSEIAAAEARAKVATEGPWHWTQTDDKEPSLLLGQAFCNYDVEKHIPAGKVELFEFDPNSGHYADTHEFDLLIACCDDERGTGCDFDFIAHARTDIPALCETARAALQQRDEAIEYARHKRECPRGLYRWNEETKQHDIPSGGCTCGLDAFLASVTQKGGG